MNPLQLEDFICIWKNKNVYVKFNALKKIKLIKLRFFELQEAI